MLKLVVLDVICCPELGQGVEKGLFAKNKWLDKANFFSVPGAQLDCTWDRDRVYRTIGLLLLLTGINPHTVLPRKQGRGQWFQGQERLCSFRSEKTGAQMFGAHRAVMDETRTSVWTHRLVIWVWEARELLLEPHMLKSYMDIKQRGDA